MDKEFQTSFIPKKPLVEQKASRSQKVSLFNFLATLVFFASLASAGGMYFYKSSLESGIEKKQADLERAQSAFDPETIKELIVLDRRLTTSKELLDSHMRVSPIFDLLSEVTVASVQFSDFKFKAPEKAGDVLSVDLIGVAPGYKTVGLEEVAFASNRFIVNPVFSNIALGLKGQVTFNVHFSIDDSFLDYTASNTTTTILPNSDTTSIIQPTLPESPSPEVSVDSSGDMPS